MATIIDISDSPGIRYARFFLLTDEDFSFFCICIEDVFFKSFLIRKYSTRPENVRSRAKKNIATNIIRICSLDSNVSRVEVADGSASNCEEKFDILVSKKTIIVAKVLFIKCMNIPV